MCLGHIAGSYEHASAASVTLSAFEQGRIQSRQDIRIGQLSVLCLSLDATIQASSDRPNELVISNTSCRSQLNPSQRLVVSRSDGGLSLLSSDGKAEVKTWKAHDFEAWIAAWDRWSEGRTLYSGWCTILQVRYSGVNLRHRRR